MNIQELCEPLFNYMCRLNRSGRKGLAVTYAQTRGELDAIVAEMQAKAASVPGLTGQYEKLEMPLLFFIDSLIAESDLPFASEWHENRLAFAHNELAGDEKFFDVLEETLAERGEAANERLAVLYTCLGLGFVGWYAGQPEFLRSKMTEIAARLHKMMDADETARVCPEAYDNIDQRDLIEPPGAKVLGILIAFIGLIAVILIANVVLYRGATGELGDALNRINETNAVPGESE